MRPTSAVSLRQKCASTLRRDWEAVVGEAGRSRRRRSSGSTWRDTRACGMEDVWFVALCKLSEHPRELRRDLAFIAEEPHCPPADVRIVVFEDFLREPLGEPSRDIQRPQRFQGELLVLARPDLLSQREDHLRI